MRYDLIYKKMKLALQKELKCHEDIMASSNMRDELADKIESQGISSHLQWLLNEYLPELEGKRWVNGSFNREEFKAWKRKIGKR